MSVKLTESVVEQAAITLRLAESDRTDRVHCLTHGVE